MAHMKYADNFQKALEDHVGETVTIYTVSGGRSGSGFTGVILYVNCSYVRILIKMGNYPYNTVNTRNPKNNKKVKAAIGASADIPLDKIACFVHNTV
jgi:hypothetical protein